MNEENQTIIKALNMYGRVPEQWELLEEIEKLKQKLEENTKIYLNTSKYASEMEGKYILEKSKNEKAAELIKKEKYIAYDQWDNEYITLSEEDILKLENILNGGDKDE